MFFALFTLWFIRETKAILFWLYLWQLKEYHIGRFLDHFQTEKGRQLLFNKLVFLKIFLLLLFLVLSYDNWPMQVDYLIDLLLISSIFILFGLYFLESFKAFKDFLEKTIKKPVWTKKSLFLTFTSLIPVIALFLVLLFGNIDTFSAMLAFDILTPVIVSAIVLFLQPLAVLGRNQIIKKASEKRAQFQNLLVVGITGSYGKTSTKEFLATILSERFSSAARSGASYGGSAVASGEGGKVLKTAEHQNSEVGVSLCILNDLKPEHEIFICEMGAYNRGGIKLLCDIVKPKIGILTGINEQHMATFGSQENIVKGKYELIKSLPEDGLSIFNGDNEYCFELYKKTLIKKRVYGLQSSISGLPLDILAYNIRAEKDFITFRVALGDEIADFKVNLMGSQNVSNVLAAAVCARELGMTLEEISKACQKIESWQSGFQLKKGINGLNIIDATYSANPDGVISHLEYLKIWAGPEGKPSASYGVNKKVIVMPCLIELGKASKEVHRRIGKKIAEVCDLAIITTKDRFEEIQEGVGSKALFIESPKEIFEKIKSFCNPGDLVLLESRVPSQLISLLVGEF